MLIDRQKAFYPVIFIAIVVALTTLVIALVENVTRDILEARQDTEIVKTLQEVFPEASFYTFEEETEIYYIYNSGRSQIGYAFYGSGYGWGGKMVILIGLEDTETIKDIAVISHKEPSYWWNKLIYDNYFDQFAGLKIEDCALKSRYKINGQVDGTTSATVSSGAVADITRKTALEKVESIT